VIIDLSYSACSSQSSCQDSRRDRTSVEGWMRSARRRVWPGRRHADFWCVGAPQGITEVAWVQAQSYCRRRDETLCFGTEPGSVLVTARPRQTRVMTRVLIPIPRAESGHRKSIIFGFHACAILTKDAPFIVVVVQFGAANVGATTHR
jgi:hypothetical protein